MSKCYSNINIFSLLFYKDVTFFSNLLNLVSEAQKMYDDLFHGRKKNIHFENSHNLIIYIICSCPPQTKNDIQELPTIQQNSMPVAALNLFGKLPFLM